jgi:hypothetical protein
MFNMIFFNRGCWLCSTVHQMLQEVQDMIQFYRESNNNNNPTINLSLQTLCSKELSSFLCNYKTCKGMFTKWLESDCNIILNYKRKTIQLQLLPQHGKDISFINMSSFKWKNGLDDPWAKISTSLNQQSSPSSTLVDLHSPPPMIEEDIEHNNDRNTSSSKKKVKYCVTHGYANSSNSLQNKLLNASRPLLEDILRNQYGMKTNEDFRHFYGDCSRSYKTEASKKANCTKNRESKLVEDANVACNALKTVLSFQQKLNLCTQIASSVKDEAISKSFAKAISSNDSQYFRLIHSANNPKQRKQRSDAFDVDLISKWMHDSCRIDTSRKSIRVGVDSDGKNIFHPIHTYTGTLYELYEDFLRSYAYESTEPTRTIKFSTFKCYAKCKCMKKASFHVCADEIEVGFQYLLEAAYDTKLKSPCVNADCTCCSNINHNNHPLQTIKSFMLHTLCPKLSFPNFNNIDYFKNVKLFQKNCCYGNCERCNSFLENSPNCILQCKSLWSSEVEVSWLRYEKVTLDSVKLNGDHYTVKEPRLHIGNMQELRSEILKQIKVYYKHHWLYNWLNNVRLMDIKNMKPNELVMQIDFSAQPSLQCQNKLNCQSTPVCTMYCAAVLHSPRKIQYQGKVHDYVECDYIRAISPAGSVGKNQDWFFHDSVFNHLLNYYKRIIPDLKKVITWTDGCPNQFKCKENLAYVACVGCENIAIIHRFAPTSQFKGIQDKIGESAKRFVRERERTGKCRCSTALEYYRMLSNNMKRPSITHKEHEKDTFAATKYMWLYVTNSTDEYKEVLDNLLYPDIDPANVILLKRENMWTVKPGTATQGSRTLYEFMSIPSWDNKYDHSKYNLLTREYPCMCKPCFNLDSVYSKDCECEANDKENNKIKAGNLTTFEDILLEG